MNKDMLDKFSSLHMEAREAIFKCVKLCESLQQQ